MSLCISRISIETCRMASRKHRMPAWESVSTHSWARYQDEEEAKLVRGGLTRQARGGNTKSERWWT